MAIMGNINSLFNDLCKKELINDRQFSYIEKTKKQLGKHDSDLFAIVSLFANIHNIIESYNIRLDLHNDIYSDISSLNEIISIDSRGVDNRTINNIKNKKITMCFMLS